MPFTGHARVTPSRHYRHPTSGRTFSQFSSWIEPGAELIDDGFTIAWDGDGTVGTMRPAWPTADQAQAFADAWNARDYETSRRLLPPFPSQAQGTGAGPDRQRAHMIDEIRKAQDAGDHAKADRLVTFYD